MFRRVFVLLLLILPVINIAPNALGDEGMYPMSELTNHQRFCVGP